MLAYEPGIPIAYSVSLLALSLTAAATVTGIGLGVSLASRARWAAALGGGIVGGGVAAMHYSGMWALQVPGYITWDPALVTASIIFGIVSAWARSRPQFVATK